MPNGLTESLARTSILAVYRAYHDEISYIALQEGVTTGLLLKEEYSTEDANELARLSDEIKAFLGKLDQAFKVASGDSVEAVQGWESIIKIFEEALAEVKPSEIINLLNDPDPKALADKTAELTKKLQKVLSEVAAIVETIEAIQKNFANLDVPQEHQGKMIADLSSLANSTEVVPEGISSLVDVLFEQPTTEPPAEEPPTEDSSAKFDFPDVKKLKSAVFKSYQEPGWFKKQWAAGAKEAEKAVADEEEGGGFMKKAMGFVKGLFAGAGNEKKIVPASSIATAIGFTPFDAFMGLEMAPFKTSLEQQTPEIADNTTQATEEAIPADDGGEQPAADEPPPATEEEAIESQESAEKAAKAAATAGAKLNEPPGVAVGKAIEGWKDALPDGTQKWLMAKGGERYNSLKGGIETVFSDQAKAVSDAVGSAITSWHEENADAIKSSNRFSKKGQTQLADMMSKMVVSLMQKKHESSGRFTYGTVKRSVYRYLDNHYFNNNMLIESRRWNELAGLGDD